MQLRQGKFYESKLLDYLRSLEIIGTYVDVGAHIGNHAIAFALMGAYRVIAFEPQWEMHALLEQNVELNGLQRRIETWHNAVHDRWVMARVGKQIPGNTGATRFEPGAPQGPVGARVVQLDHALGHPHHVGLIKVDVEGEELAVLRSAKNTIVEHKPIIVAEAQEHRHLVALVQHLRPLGYTTDGVTWGATPTYVWHPS